MRARYVLIRDDDISFFTPLKQFQEAHRYLLDHGIPFNVAVVPNVSDGVQTRDGGFEGFIPEERQGKGGYYPVYENDALVAFLKSTETVEPLQHGFTHERTVNGYSLFAGTNVDRIRRALDEGTGIFKTAFGQPASTFVPPFDTVSRQGLMEIRQRFQGIGLARFPHELLPMHMWPKFVWNKRRHRMIFPWNEFWLVQHPGLDFTAVDVPSVQNKDPHIKLPNVRDVFVLTLHSWRFFTPEGKVISSLLNRWESFLEYLQKDIRLQFLTFTDIYQGNLSG